MRWFGDFRKERLDRRFSPPADLNELRAAETNLDDRRARPDQQQRTLAPMAPDSTTIRLDVFRSILETMKPGRLLDLAAGHGKFAVIARDLGWAVTAVDARTERFPDSEGIEWIHSDLREYDIGDFDVVCLLGIFYHLELSDQLKLLTRCVGTTTIIDTHVALRAELEEGGYEGRYFSEDLSAPTASWINKSSFWPTEEGLVRMLHESGFSFVFKLIPPPTRMDRTWYVCR